VRVCTACARKTDESGRFCPDCGAALVELGTAATQHSFPGSPSGDATGEISASSATKLLGLTIDGQFKIQSILGGGAFGTVYKCSQVGLDRPVAMKVPTYEIAADPVMAKRFAREARSAARVQHPGVVSIYAVGELPDGRPYLAMEYIDGQPLDRILETGPIDGARALEIARLVASALSETHAADVVHRDLKPTNIMWRRDRNGDDRITLVDFGIAVCKPGNADATRLTADGLIGTPHYMAPEQAHGDEVDARADLYALGCIVFELVTGAPPFAGSGFEVLLAHLGRPAPLPSEKNPSVPETIDRLCAALMAKKPEQRPQSADELVALIDTALDELGGRSGKAAATPIARARKTTRPPLTMATRRDLPEGAMPPRQRRTRRLMVGVALGVLALAGAGFAVFEMRGSSKAAVADPLEQAPLDNDPRVGRRRSLVKDNGEMIVNATVPDPLIARQEIRSRLEIKNKLGQPVIADEIVLTIADETGAAKGLTARPRTAREGMTAEDLAGLKGKYYFKYTFPKPGRYTLRVFPPSVDSSFEIPIDVQ
jgi:eukaryotic-like serine/threonine-protein kinase